MHRPKTALLACLGAVLLALNLSAMAATPAHRSVSAKQVINLDSGWEFHALNSERPELGQWRPAEVPGVVQTDLLHNKLIGDPFYREAESRLQWIGLTDWEYRSTCQVDAKTLGRRHIELVFDGLDTYATVFVNEHEALKANNMFRQWRIDAKPLLKAGANAIRIVFKSPINEVMPLIENDPYRLPTVHQVQIISEKGIATDPYTRKAPYNYGWDWGPRFVTLGIWRPVRLESWDDVVIRDLHIQQNDISKQFANVSANLELEAAENSFVTVTVSWMHIGSRGPVMQSTRAVRLNAGSNVVELPIEIVNPALWYPNGYGAQDLYRFKATVSHNGAPVDTATVRTGLRSLVLSRVDDQWGKSFEFVVNGIPVFAKGADVIPFDSFPTRVGVEQYRPILESARDAHMNMIRSWGGGYYESSEFYDLCDELGLMIWQDFMFGGAQTPGTPAFLDNVRQEAIDNIKRIRNHPSLAIWCGNNEVEAAWFFWGDRKEWKASLPDDVREKVWQDYVFLFNGILPTLVAQYGGGAPYWPSSPSADFDDLPGSQHDGDMHYWEVWHALAPLEKYREQFPRFMSEYGFQSFPEMRTIQSFALPSDMSIDSPVMLAHQKNVGGNDRIHNYMLRYFREPKDFASFLYVSQVLQAEAIKIGAEHLRRNRPRVMGSLYWQLNDCWPVASWSSIDYFGRWKALQYYARRFYNDLLVSPVERDGELSVYVVSDRLTSTPAQLRVRLMDLNGKILLDHSVDVNVPSLSSASYWGASQTQLLNGADPASVLVAVDLSVAGKTVSRNLYFFAPMKDVNLPTPKLDAQLTPAANGYRLKVTTPALARDVYVTFGDVDATASDNYFDLLPGESVELQIKTKAGLDQLRAAMKITTLDEAFAPATTSASGQ